MTRYVDTMLEPGEILRYRTSTSAFFAYRWPTAASVTAAWILFQQNEWGNPEYDEAAMYAGLFCALLFISAWIKRLCVEIAVTDRRVIYKQPFWWLFGLATEEMNMEAIESVAIRQGLFGSLLNYGQVFVRGSGSSWVGSGSVVDNPLVLRATMTHSGGSHA